MEEFQPATPDELNQMAGAGFQPSEVEEMRQRSMQNLVEHGFKPEEALKYYGVKEPDTSAMKDFVSKNISQYHADNKDKPQEAKTLLDAVAAGWGSSVTGLGLSGHMPDTVMPEHAGFAMRMASQVSQLAGDMPAMMAGGTMGAMMGAPIGGAAGTAVGPVGTLGGIALGSASGGMAGAFAAPAGLRKLLMDHYEKGDITSAGDFMERLTAATWDAAKAGTVGALTGVAGAVVKPVGMAAGLGAELATMTTAGAAMQGRLPEAQDFVDGAVLIGGFHAAADVLPAKLREIYRKTGERPEQVAEAVNNDPVLRQELLSDNSDLPSQAKKPEPKGESIDETASQNATGQAGEEKAPQDEAQLAIQADRDKVLSRVAEQPKPEQFDAKDLFTRDGVDKLVLKVRTAMEDKLLPILENEKESGLNFNAENSPYIAARSYQGWTGQAIHMLTEGTLDYGSNKKNGEGLQTIADDLDKAGIDIKEFRAFSLAKRSEERLDQGKETGIDTEAAKRIIEHDQKRLGPYFDRLVAFNDRMRQYYADAGGLSDKQQEFIDNASKDYIPLARVVDTDPFTGEPVKDRNGKLFPFMEGSEKLILDPFQQMARKAVAIAQFVAKNDVGKNYAEMIRNSEFGAGLGEIKDTGTGASNEISFYENGERKTIALPKDTAEAIKSLGADPQMTNFAIKMLNGFAGMLRFGTVLNPDFIVRHFDRTLFMRAVQGDGPITGLLTNVAGSLRAIGTIWKEDQHWQDYMSSRAAQADISGAMEYLQNNFWEKQNAEDPSLLKRIWNVPHNIKQALEYGSMLADNATRVAEFKQRAYQDAIDGATGKPIKILGSKQQIMDAGFAARESTLDYNRIGSQMKIFSTVVPFVNVGIQGNSRMIRGMINDPVGFGTKAMAMITVPSLLTYYYNHNDSRYQTAPNWEKDVYWLFPTDKWEPASSVADAASRPEDLRRQMPDGSWQVNNGQTIKVMKPFELGILFGSLPERLMARYIGDNPRAMHDFAASVGHGIVPNVLPTALTPVLEQATNYNFFTGRPVVSSQNEKLLPEYQYNEYTSFAAKQLGSLFAKFGLDRVGPQNARLASPEVIDNYIHDWTGQLGQYAMTFINSAAYRAGVSGNVPQPEWGLASYPFIKAFVARYPTAQAQPIQDFYEDYSRATTMQASIKALQTQGQFDEAAKLQSKSQGDLLRLDDIKKAIGVQAGVVRFIHEEKTMDGAQKRQLMDQAYYQMVVTAQQGNKIMDAYRKGK